jgi:DNA primase
MLIQHPRLASELSDIGVPGELDVPGAPLLLELIELLRRNPEFGTATVLERYRNEEAGRHLAKLAIEELPALGDGIGEEFSDAVRAVQRQAEEVRLQARRDELEARINAGRASDEEKQEYREVIARLGRVSQAP